MFLNERVSALSKHCTYLLIMIFISALLASDIPRVINYQAKLTDSSGIALNDTVTMIFRIYNAPTGGVLLWMEAHPNVPIVKGLFDEKLGETTPINLPFDRQYYIELEVNMETLMPRTPLLTVPYAFRALYTDTAEYSIYSDTAIYALSADTTNYAFYAESASIAAVDWDTLQYYAMLDTLSYYAPVETLSYYAPLGTLTAYSDTSHTHALSDLSDVDTAGLTTGYVLKWNGIAWVPAVDNTGGTVAESTFIWNQDTTAQPANLRITGTATVGTLSTEDIRGQGYVSMEYSGSPISVDDSTFIVLFSSSYGAAGSGSGIMITFTGTFDDRANKKGAGMEIQLVRDPGAGETILTSQREIIADHQAYGDRSITLTAMDFPPAGTHTYAVRAKVLYQPLDAGRFVKGNIQIVEVKQ